VLSGPLDADLSGHAAIAVPAQNDIVAARIKADVFMALFLLNAPWKQPATAYFVPGRYPSEHRSARHNKKGAPT
jgi:hypothetical protein